MEERTFTRTSLPLFILFWLCLICFTRSVHAYKNYTVGDTLGWYDNTEKPNHDYQKWADAKSFSLGDFLIFNTDNNHSVILTYNSTTYKECDDSQDSDAIHWSTTNPSNTSPQPMSIAVPLLKTGMTYFFSGDYEGDQCRNGLHFSINVTYGKGLPESLKDPKDQAPAPNSPDMGSDEVTPDTIVPANFDHPKDISDDTESQTSMALSISAFSKFFGIQLHGILILIGLSCIC